MDKRTQDVVRFESTRSEVPLFQIFHLVGFQRRYPEFHACALTAIAFGISPPLPIANSAGWHESIPMLD